ncbi:MAG: ATP-binding protein [Desulfonatronovibrio sp.]
MKSSDPKIFFWKELTSATKDNLDELKEFILDNAREKKVPELILPKIDLVLEEVLLNIINYAYPENQKADIQIGFGISSTKLSIRIIDQGREFDPSAKPDPDISLSVEERKIGGLGILLVRKISDEFSYQRSNNRNILDIAFNLDS